jgi:hypothetical protein
MAMFSAGASSSDSICTSEVRSRASIAEASGSTSAQAFAAAAVRAARVIACGVVATIAMPANAAPAAGEPSMTVAIAAPAAEPSGRIPWIEVRLGFTGLEAAGGTPLMRLPLVLDNSQGVADVLQELAATDSHGAVALTFHDTTAPADADRHWTSARPITGALTVRYRVPIANAPNVRGAAPAYEVRSDGGAFSGLGSMFIMQPEAPGEYRLSIHWDLGAVGTGALGVSSFGVGDVEVAPGPAERLGRAYFMGGRIGHYPAVLPRTGGFLGAWQGSPPYDAPALMAWTEHLQAYYRGFFRDHNPATYIVFARPNPITAGSGIGLINSFLVTFGPQTQAADLEGVTAHEMLHTWVSSLDKPDGLESSWFGEGLAVYYERELPLRAGAFTPAEFLKDLNETAARYYTDAFIHTPNSQIPAGFWRDTRIRVLPYDRGSLYFATVNSKVLAASHGTRSLDDLVLAMLERRRAGQPMDFDAWVALLRAALGPQGPKDLDAMLAGATVLPDSDAFGRCFERTTATLRRYQLGFDPASLVSQPRIVKGLIADSAAAQAGVRDGDEIVRPVSQDNIQANQQATLTLQLRRGTDTRSITYLPRGEAVEAYQWRRVPGVPDSECSRRH